MRKHIVLGSLLALGFGVQAVAADGLSYNLLEGGYSYSDLKHTSTHGDGFSVGGSFAFGESFVGFGNVSTTDYSGFNVKGISLGLGFHAEASSALDFVSGVSYEIVDPESFSSENGFGVSVGLRGRASDKLELNGGVKYVDFGHSNDGIVFGVGSRYYFTDAFAAGLDIAINDQSDTTTFGLMFRYDFGG